MCRSPYRRASASSFRSGRIPGTRWSRPARSDLPICLAAPAWERARSAAPCSFSSRDRTCSSFRCAEMCRRGSPKRGTREATPRDRSTRWCWRWPVCAASASSNTSPRYCRSSSPCPRAGRVRSPSRPCAGAPPKRLALPSRMRKRRAASARSGPCSPTSPGAARFRSRPTRWWKRTAPCACAPRSADPSTGR